jgi:hypothetical protein
MCHNSDWTLVGIGILLSVSIVAWFAVATPTSSLSPPASNFADDSGSGETSERIADRRNTLQALAPQKVGRYQLIPRGVGIVQPPTAADPQSGKKFLRVPANSYPRRSPVILTVLVWETATAEIDGEPVSGHSNLFCFLTLIPPRYRGRALVTWFVPESGGDSGQLGDAVSNLSGSSATLWAAR